MLYTKGCNFRCPYCHNRSLVLNKALKPVPKVMEQLAVRRGFSDGVVITGGEPTIHRQLDDLMAAIKQLGFALKLDTNGYEPEALRELINEKLIDFVAMDIKTSLPKYRMAAGMKINPDRITESVKLIKESGLEHEFRTTCVPTLVDNDDIEKISRLVGQSGRYTLQQFQPVDTLNQDYNQIKPYSPETLACFLETARRNVDSCRLIGID